MGKTSYPYVIAWRCPSGRIDLWTKRDGWGAAFREDIAYLYATKTEAETAAFLICARHGMVGEDVMVYRMNELLELPDVARHYNGTSKMLVLKLSRAWLRDRKRRVLTKYRAELDAKKNAAAAKLRQIRRDQ